MLGLLVEKNQQWAKTAYALGFRPARRRSARAARRTGSRCTIRARPSANLAIEATALGLRTHFMGGFDAQRARSEFHVPDDFEIGAAFAIGYIDETAIQPGGQDAQGLGGDRLHGRLGQSGAAVEWAALASGRL